MDVVPRSLSGSTCLVTGASGFVGRHVVDALVRRGARVRALDVATMPQTAEGVTRIRGDITKPDDVAYAMQGVDVVFHTAATVFLGEHAPKHVRDAMFAINVEGTQNLLDAAIASGTTRFVHTSSAGVCFGPRTSGGDESLPYSAHRDLYTRTKVEAEKRVLAANGRGALLTCALRPGGIYGPGERNHLLKPLLASVRRGEPLVTIGDGRSKVDYTYVDNLVDAELRAAERLTPGSRVAGQAYFVSDEQPIGHAEFGGRLCARMGLDVVMRSVPGKALELFAIASERLYALRGAPVPQVTRLQVRACRHDSHYSTARARRDLGYAPLVNTFQGIDRCVVDALALYRALPTA